MVPRWDLLSKEERKQILEESKQSDRFADKPWKDLPFWTRKQVIPALNKFDASRSKSKESK